MIDLNPNNEEIISSEGGYHRQQSQEMEIQGPNHQPITLEASSDKQIPKKVNMNIEINEYNSNEMDRLGISPRDRDIPYVKPATPREQTVVQDQNKKIDYKQYHKAKTDYARKESMEREYMNENVNSMNTMHSVNSLESPRNICATNIKQRNNENAPIHYSNTEKSNFNQEEEIQGKRVL